MISIAHPLILSLTCISLSRAIPRKESTSRPPSLRAYPISPPQPREKRDLSVHGFDLSGAYYSYKQNEQASSTSNGYLLDNYSEIIAKTLERADQYINSLANELKSSELIDVAQSSGIGGSYILLSILAFFIRSLFKRLSRVESQTLSDIPTLKQSLHSVENKVNNGPQEDKLDTIISRLNSNNQPLQIHPTTVTSRPVPTFSDSSAL